MILKSFNFQCDFDFDFQITTSKMILILNHLYLGDLILILKSSTYDDFAHLCVRFGEVQQWEEGLSVPQGPCIIHFFTISCKTGSSLALGISAVGELYKC